MSVIVVKCTDQVLTFENTPIITSGGRGENFVKFSFCTQWDGFVKTAVFWRTEHEPYHVLLDEDNTCTIPYEVLTKDGRFYFGVFGVNTSYERRTSEVLSYLVAKGAITEGTQPSDPTPEIYDKLLAEYSIAQAKYAEAIQGMKECTEKIASSIVLVEFTPKTSGVSTYTNTQYTGGQLREMYLAGAVILAKIGNAVTTCLCVGVKEGGIGADGVVFRHPVIEGMAPNTVLYAKVAEDSYDFARYRTVQGLPVKETDAQTGYYVRMMSSGFYELVAPPLSAYESAQKGGYTGTEAEFYAALAALGSGTSGGSSGGDDTGDDTGGSSDTTTTITWYLEDEAGGELTGDYQAASGMTWGEFVESNHNTLGLALTSDGYVTGGHDARLSWDSTEQHADDVIQAGATYYLTY